MLKHVVVTSKQEHGEKGCRGRGRPFFFAPLFFPTPSLATHLCHQRPPPATMVATRRSATAGSARGVGSPAASKPASKGVSRVATEFKLVFAVAGIFFAFSAFAVLQEDVYRSSYGGERFRATFLVLIVERGVNTLVGLIGTLVVRWGSNDRTRGESKSTATKMKVPFFEIATSGISQMAAMAAANEALRFVSFPTQVLGKSCKSIPVMVGGIASGRAYPRSQYVQVLAVTAGVVVFNLGAPKKGPSADDDDVSSAYGLTLIVCSLFFDFITAALQDRVKTATVRRNPHLKNPKTNMFESMAWTNFGGVFVAFLLAVCTGQLADGVSFCNRHPGMQNAIAYYALASVLGQLFVYFTITEFDPLVLSTVTTTRKIFSTVYSAARSPGSAMSGMQIGGCACVFAAIAWETLEKYRKAQGMGLKKKRL